MPFSARRATLAPQAEVAEPSTREREPGQGAERLGRDRDEQQEPGHAQGEGRVGPDREPAGQRIEGRRHGAADPADRECRRSPAVGGRENESRVTRGWLWTAAAGGS